MTNIFKIFSAEYRFIFLVLILGSIASTASAQNGQDNSQPNILFILADDQGWNHHSVPMFEDASSANSEYYQTPNIESIANEGMRFSTAYSAAPMCNPSRRSLHVGKSMSQVMFSGASEEELAAAFSIGEMMQSAGYRTAHFGKWSPGPAESGLDFYDVSDGPLGNGDGNLNASGDPKQIFGITDRASAFMEDSVNAGQPFYMQLSHFAPHTQPHALDGTLEKWTELDLGGDHNPALAAMTEDLDTGVGALLDKLEALGVRENTYVIYSSDHGQSPGSSSNPPLSFGKGTLWEGGVRVPFIVSGPGIEAGALSHARTTSLDLLPTFAELAGITQPLPADIEGGNLMPVLLGTGDEVTRPREELVFHFPSGSGQADFRPMSTMYLGDYKLVKFYDTDEIMLFNITEDIGEQNNLADNMSSRTDEMNALLVSYLDEMGVMVFGPAANDGERGARGAGGPGAAAGGMGGMGGN